MKNIFLLLFLTLLLVSCSSRKKFPQLATQKISAEKLTVTNYDSVRALKTPVEDIDVESSECLNQLLSMVENYNQKNENFDFDNLKADWESCKVSINPENMSEIAAKKWIEATGLLLQLTAEAKYAEELEKIYLAAKNQAVEKEAASYVFTQNVDHIHVNLFVPAEINYEHSLSGKVSIVQECNYPESGRVELKFSMEKKRYIELYIRIPSWAKDAHVTVKGVKYFAPAGGYCFIAKKWHEGDLVEIVFPNIHNQTIG